jgi:rRNA-processing protein FCF1
MRVNRAKMVRKYLRFYRLVFGVNPPYNVLLDGNFIYAALKNKINIPDRLASMLQGEQFTLYVLKSSIDELRQIGAKGETALDFGLQKCTTLDDSDITGSTPFDKMIGYLGMHISPLPC